MSETSGDPEVQTAAEGGIDEAALSPEQAAAMELAQMFVRDEKHINCPVAGVSPYPDGTLDITFQVGHNHFHSYRIGKPGQKAIADAYQAGATDLVIPDGPLPPPTDARAGRSRPRR